MTTLEANAETRVIAPYTPIVMFSNSMMVGGMEAHIVALASGLVHRGLRVAVVCPAGEAIASFREQLAEAGVTVHALPADRRGPHQFPSRLARLVSILRHYPGHILHIHNTGSDGGALPMLAARLAGARALIRTEHQPPDYPVSLRQRLLIRARDRALTRIICVSQANLEQHVRDLKRDRRKFVSIPNCVDLSVFAPSGHDDARRVIRELAGAAEDDLVVGMLGRLAEPRKGAEFFVDMAHRLSDLRPGVKCIIVGEGPRRSQLEARARGKVAFLGRQPDAAACYAAMDIVAIPSLWEGGPITVLESMAMERPTVTTDVGMVREVIKNGENGVIVPPGSVDALVDAVLSLVDDPKKRADMAQRGRRTVESRFTPDVMVDSVARLYAESVRLPLRT